LAFNNLTSGLLQTLLFVVKESDHKLAQKLISKLLDECFTVRKNVELEIKTSEHKSSTPDGQNILPVFEDVAAVHLLEAAITSASPKKLTQIYARCFINHLATLSQHPVANFSVQKLLDCCTEKAEFEGMFSELEGYVEEILNSRNTGVILSLAEACKRHSSKQGSFQNLLMKALHCTEPKERQSLLSPLTLSLVAYEEHAVSNKLRVHLHGSLILQTLLNFNKPIQAVNSILEMNTDILKMMLTDPKGCHVTDAFMKSEFIGEKSRDRFIKKLQVSVRSCTLLCTSLCCSGLLRPDYWVSSVWGSIPSVLGNLSQNVSKK
jgi:nucleolar protein 9